MFSAHPFQEEVKAALREGFRAGHVRQCLGMATGSGKTVVASHIAMAARDKGKRCLFIVHLKTLVWQAARHFHECGLTVGIMQADNTYYTEEHDIIVASVHTMKNRGCPDWVRLIIIDECHLLYKAHIELIERWNAIPVIGLSATPMRKDLGKYFTRLVRGPSVAWLTDNGFLTPVRAYYPGAKMMEDELSTVGTKQTPDGQDYNPSQTSKLMRKARVIGDCVRSWMERGEGRPTLCFAVDKAHSRELVAEFIANGITAEHIEDKTKDADRQRIIQDFRDGKTKVLSSVGVLAIGFDVPLASCLLLARPTLSLALHIQQTGRGIRSCDGKEDCIVLDHVGNIYRHGLPEDFVIPDLDTGEHKTATRKKREPKKAVCEGCEYQMAADVYTCPECGLDRPKPLARVEYVDGVLVEYKGGKRGNSLRQMEKATFPIDPMDEFRMLLWYAQEHGYRKGWAYHKWVTRHPEKEKPPARWFGIKPRPPSRVILSWIKSQQIAWAKRKHRDHY